MPEVISCDVCKIDVHREDWPQHKTHCGGLAVKTPRLPVSGFLIRLDAGRVRIITLGPCWLLGVTFVEADWSVTELGAAMNYLKTQLDEQGE